jgi:hypothetical protein
MIFPQSTCVSHYDYNTSWQDFARKSLDKDMHWSKCVDRQKKNGGLARS